MKDTIEKAMIEKGNEAARQGDMVGAEIWYCAATARGNARETAVQLIRSMQDLADSLTRAAAFGETVLIDWHPNSLGEIQGRGSAIDIECAKLRCQQNYAATLARVAENYAKRQASADSVTDLPA